LSGVGIGPGLRGTRFFFDVVNLNLLTLATGRQRQKNQGEKAARTARVRARFVPETKGIHR